MFDLSWSHIAILVVIALLVLGPKELPNAIRTGAQLLRTGRKLAGEFRSGMDELIREAELEETRQQISKAMSEGLENTIAEHVDPEGDIKSAISTDPLAQAEAEAAGGADAAEQPKLIEHEAPPAPPHSIVPPEEGRPAPDAASPPAEAPEALAGAEGEPAAESEIPRKSASA